MAGSFVGQRGPREQMRIGEEKDVGRKKDDEGGKREGEGDCSRKRNAIFASLLPPPPLFCFRCTKLRSSFDSFPQGKLGAALG